MSVLSNSATGTRKLLALEVWIGLPQSRATLMVSGLVTGSAREVVSNSGTCTSRPVSKERVERTCQKSIDDVIPSQNNNSFEIQLLACAGFSDPSLRNGLFLPDFPVGLSPQRSMKFGRWQRFQLFGVVP